MPSSLIIVALAVAWLVVLVPMVARKRSEITRTGDDALASRVVRSGSAGGVDDEEPEENIMSESAAEDERSEIAVPSGTRSEPTQLGGDEIIADDLAEDEELMDADDPADDAAERADVAEHDDVADRSRPIERSRRVEYRPGRGGFDPEAAELAAKAKYAFRQRVVLALLATVVISALLAGFVLSALWWVNGTAIAALAGYLAYLRRQVRIEENIRQRRLARLAGSRAPSRRLADLDADLDAGLEADHEGGYDDGYDHGYAVADEPLAPRGVERKPRPHSRQPRRNAVVVDIDDEDPAFHELDQPGPPVYRRAVGE